MSKQNALFPIKIKNQLIKTKIFFAPINTGYSINGKPNKEFIKFYKIISGKNIGISYIGNVAIGKEYVTNSKTAYFNKKDLMTWKKVVQIINENGSIPGIQLGCRYSNILPEINMNLSKEEKQQYINKAKEEIFNIPTKKIKEIIQMYIDTAITSYELGFRVIQIHAAHGYFLSLMLSNNFNCRDDIYGINKLRILNEIIDGILDKIPDVVLDIRLSLNEGIEPENDEIFYKEKIINEIQKMGVSMISISNGIYNMDKTMIYPKKNDNYNKMLQYVKFLAKKYPNIIWNVAGNMENAIFNRQDDVENLTFSIGRQLLADPETFYKYSNNNEDKIIKCSDCGMCHYYSKSESSLNGCITKNKDWIN